MPLKNVYPSDRTWVYTQACGQCKTRSATARQILQYLEKKPYGYDIIILKDDEEFGQMMAPTGSTGTDLFDDKDKKHALYRRLTGKISIDRPVVLWNPKFKFNYYSDVQGLEDNGPTEVNLKLIYSGKKVPYVMTYGKGNKEKARIICATSNFMPPEITLFHELGHVKQYFESYRYQWINFTDDLIRLEADNLARHEHPISKTLPFR